MDDRAIIQTNKVKLSAALFLGREWECDQDADLLCINCPTVDGSNQEKGRDEEIIC